MSDIRVAVLYGGGIFACRKCYQLAYPSQREDTGNRAARRAHRIRDRMGWPGSILEGSGWGKPKGMHWRTYERLCDEHDTLEDVVNCAFIDHFGPILKKRGVRTGLKRPRCVQLHQPAFPRWTAFS